MCVFFEHSLEDISNNLGYFANKQTDKLTTTITLTPPPWHSQHQIYIFAILKLFQLKLLILHLK